MIISAGFDSAEGDDLGGVGVTPTGYAYMTWKLRELCRKTAVILEGGYDLQALERSSEAVVRTLLIPPDDKPQFTSLLAELSGRPECSID
jgi:histone deacetylase 6